jgi:hypothetical protein
MLKGAYTLSKTENQSDSDGRATVSWNTPSEYYRNYTLAGFDRTHNFQLGFAYQLPWQSKDGYGNVLKAIANDWQINGLLAAFSGTPFTVTANGSQLNTPSNQQTADLTGTFNVLGAIGATGPWFDTTQFAQPTGVRFGNTGRNQFRGPGGYNLDFSLFRSFPIGGARRLEYRLQAGNLFNHPVYGNPNGDITSSNFGRVTGVANQYPERMIQMGLRFSF